MFYVGGLDRTGIQWCLLGVKEALSTHPPPKKKIWEQGDGLIVRKSSNPKVAAKVASVFDI